MGDKRSEARAVEPWRPRHAQRPSARRFFSRGYWGGGGTKQESAHCFGAIFTPGAPLCFGAFISSEAPPTHRRRHHARSSPMLWRQLQTKSSSTLSALVHARGSSTHWCQLHTRTSLVLWRLHFMANLTSANHQEPAIEDQLELRVDLFEEELHMLVIGRVTHQQDVVLGGDGRVDRLGGGLDGEGDMEGA